MQLAASRVVAIGLFGQSRHWNITVHLLVPFSVLVIILLILRSLVSEEIDAEVVSEDVGLGL